MRAVFLSVLLLLLAQLCKAQFPPQAGIAGSTAIAASDARLKAWASGCTVTRGYLNIATPDSGRVSQGDSLFASGSPDGQVVSLGDSGIALLRFSYPVRNGDGADFAVFENGFPNPMNGEEAFLELAFVEVSSDGTNFTRFPAISNVPFSPQLSSIAGAGYINARQIHNLAGKYRGGWGTPFDLQELTGTPGLDVNSIKYVRIVDVIGAVNSFGSKDKDGALINDPYPTAFATGGFDLDAVGVINSTAPNSVRPEQAHPIAISPNPATETVRISNVAPNSSYKLYDILGVPVALGLLDSSGRIDISALQSGTYLISVENDGRVWRGKISKY